MASNVSTSIPHFGLLTATATVTFSTVMGLVPLLPLLFVHHPIRYPSVCLFSFVIPAIPVHIFFSRKSVYSSRTVLQTFANTAAFAVALILLATVICPYLLIFSIGYSLLGVVFFALQAAAPFFIHDELQISSARRRYRTGLHLAFLNGCTALGAVLTPPFFAFLAMLFPHKSSSVILPLAFATTTHILLASFITFTTRQGQTLTVTSTSEQTPLLGTIPTLLTRNNQSTSLKQMLRYPWTWFVFLAMLTANGTIAFFRPLLTPIVLQSSGSIMKAALVHALVAAMSLLAEFVTPSFIAPYFGTRSTLVFGIVLTAFGAHIVNYVPISVAVAIISFGAGTTLVIALSDLARTTNDTIDYSVPASLLCFSLITASDIVSYAAIMALPDSPMRKCVSYAANIVGPVMIVVAMAIVIPYIFALLANYLVPLVMLFVSFSQTGEHEQQAVLPCTAMSTPTPRQSDIPRDRNANALAVIFGP